MEDIRAFFSRYLSAWNQPAELSRFYGEPFIAARLGSTTLNLTRRDTELLFEAVLEKYRARSFDHARLIDIREISLGTNSKLATVRWAYEDASARTLWEWSFSYNLYKVEVQWQIITQTQHDERAVTRYIFASRSEATCLRGQHGSNVVRRKPGPFPNPRRLP